MSDPVGGAVAGADLATLHSCHLVLRCCDHTIWIDRQHILHVAVRKTDPGISGINDGLKAAGVIDVAQWRFIQHLGDIRNL
jgi:hypothetical protein